MNANGFVLLPVTRSLGFAIDRQREAPVALEVAYLSVYWQPTECAGVGGQRALLNNMASVP